MNHYIKQFVAGFWYNIGLYSKYFVSKSWKPGNFLILNYHRVDERVDVSPPSLNVNIFEKQMEFLAKNYNVVLIDELAKCFLENKQPEPLSVAITFDDGYADTYEMAFPIMENFGIKGTVFLATGPMNGGLIWTDRASLLWDQVQKRDIIKHKFSLLEKSGFYDKHKDELTSGNFKTHLKNIEASERNHILEQIGDFLNYPLQVTSIRGLMTWGQARALHRAGWSIGAHTETHPILSILSEDKIRHEIVSSRESIYEEIGVRPEIFCYPNGEERDYNDLVIKILKEEGFIASVTTIPGINNLETDPFQFKRLWTTESHHPLFARRLKVTGSK